jgi:hypothetical protein
MRSTHTVITPHTDASTFRRIFVFLHRVLRMNMQLQNIRPAQATSHGNISCLLAPGARRAAAAGNGMEARRLVTD